MNAIERGRVVEKYIRDGNDRPTLTPIRSEEGHHDSQIDARHEGAAMSPRSDIAQALARLAQAGYVRRFELRHGQLWCASCDVTFDAKELVIDAVVPVVDDGITAWLYALECRGCAAAGVWLVRLPGGDEERLIETIGRPAGSASDERGARGSPGRRS
jgi:hypothetical protein